MVRSNMQSEEENQTLSPEHPTDGDEAQRKLVILGIPWETQSETLRSYFSQFCPVQVRALYGCGCLCQVFSLPGSYLYASGAVPEQLAVS